MKLGLVILAHDNSLARLKAEGEETGSFAVELRGDGDSWSGHVHCFSRLDASVSSILCRVAPGRRCCLHAEVPALGRQMLGEHFTVFFFENGNVQVCRLPFQEASRFFHMGDVRRSVPVSAVVLAA